MTIGKIADILQARSQLDEALKIRHEEELPIYERLGDVRSLLVGPANLAINLLTRGRAEDRGEARRLLHLALEAARRLKLPEARQIEAVIEQAGNNIEARQECAASGAVRASRRAPGRRGAPQSL